MLHKKTPPVLCELTKCNSRPNENKERDCNIWFNIFTVPNVGNNEWNDWFYLQIEWLNQITK